MYQILLHTFCTLAKFFLMVPVINRQKNGIVYEVCLFKKLSADLATQPTWTDVHGRALRQVYIYGGALTMWHREFLKGECDEDTMVRHIVRRARTQNDQISYVQGMDGLLVTVDTSDGSIVSFDEVIEVKCSQQRRSLIMTLYLADDMARHDRLMMFRIFHQYGLKVHFDEEVYRIRRLGHTVSVDQVKIDECVIQEQFCKMYPTQAEDENGLMEEGSKATYRERKWSVEQAEAFDVIIQTREKVFRLKGEVGVGKSNAIVTIMASPRVVRRFVIRCVVNHSLASQYNMATTFAKRNLPFLACNCQTSGKHTMFVNDDDDEEEMRVRIRSMIRAECEHVQSDGSYKPPVFGVVKTTVPLMLELIEQLLTSELCLFAIDEVQEFHDEAVIRKMLSMPQVKVLQVSATYECYDLAMQHIPGWVVEPYYTYTYAQAVQDGLIVPARVYIMANTEYVEEERKPRFYQICKTMLLHFPYASIISVAYIEEAQYLATRLRDEFANPQLPDQQFLDKVFAVHSRMNHANSYMDGEHNVERVMAYAKTHPMERIIIVACQMANSSIDIPHIVNVFNFCTAENTPCEHHQKMGRGSRASPGKRNLNYIVLCSQRDAVHAMKHLCDDGECISLYDNVDGSSLMAVSQSLTRYILRPRNSDEHKTGWKSRIDTFEELRAFPDLAFRSLQRVWTSKQRASLQNSDEMISVQGVGGRLVQMNTRKITDRILETFNCIQDGRRIAYPLPESFPYPEYCLMQRSRSFCKDKVVLTNQAGCKINDVQRQRLETEQNRPLTDDEWSFLKKANLTSANKLFRAYETGTYQSESCFIPMPELKNFKMSIDVEATIVLYKLRRSKLDPSKDRQWFDWIMRRVKLLQMRYLNHPHYKEKMEAECNRLNRKRKLPPSQN